MNKGIIYKVKFYEKEFYIKLERRVVINGKEYNIYIDQSSLSATLFSVDTTFTADADLTALIGKKLNFEIGENINIKDKSPYKIISVEYEA